MPTASRPPSLSVDIVVFVLFLGYIASLPRLIADRDGRLSARASATLAVGVGFVVLVILDRVMGIVLALDAESAGPSLIQCRWYADGFREPAFVALAGFFVATIAAEARRHGTLPPAATRSGVPLGLIIGIGLLIHLALPTTVGTSLSQTLILLFAIVALWMLVVAVTMVSRARETAT